MYLSNEPKSLLTCKYNGPIYSENIKNFKLETIIKLEKIVPQYSIYIGTFHICFYVKVKMKL